MMTEQPAVPVRVVVCAACYRNGTLVIGPRHFDSTMRDQIEVYEALSADEGDLWAEGFIDQWGKFMDRYEALEVATAAGQVGVRRPKTTPVDRLFSEDLY